MCIYIYISGQIITTSAEVTLNGGLIRELPQNPLNSGLGIILICPDIYYSHSHLYIFTCTNIYIFFVYAYMYIYQGRKGGDLLICPENFIKKQPGGFTLFSHVQIPKKEAGQFSAT